MSDVLLVALYTMVVISTGWLLEKTSTRILDMRYGAQYQHYDSCLRASLTAAKQTYQPKAAPEDRIYHVLSYEVDCLNAAKLPTYDLNARYLNR